MTEHDRSAGRAGILQAPVRKRVAFGDAEKRAVTRSLRDVATILALALCVSGASCHSRPRAFMEMVVMKDGLARLKHGRLVRVKRFDRVDDETFRRREKTRMKFEIQRVDAVIHRGPDPKGYPVVHVTLVPSDEQRFIDSLRSIGLEHVAFVVGGRVLDVGPVVDRGLWEGTIRFHVPTESIADSFVLGPR